MYNQYRQLLLRALICMLGLFLVFTIVWEVNSRLTRSRRQEISNGFSKDYKSKVIPQDSNHGVNTSDNTGQYIEQVRRDTTESDASTLVGYRIPIKGMALATQPSGFINSAIQESPDGRRVAFLSYKPEVGQIVIVRDTHTGSEMVVPVPKAKVYECRNIHYMAWDQNGKILYVVEEGTHGVTDLAGFRALTLSQQVAQSQNDFSVLYSWQLDDAKVHVLAQGNHALALSGGKNRVFLATVSNEDENKQIVEIHEYSDGQANLLQKVRMAKDGKDLRFDSLQFLPGRNELWFCTSYSYDPTQAQPIPKRWLAEVSFNNLKAGVQFVVPDASSFIWTQDESKAIIKTVKTDKSGNYSFVFLTLPHDQLDRPVVWLTTNPLPNKGIGLSISGISNNGETLYLTGLTKPAVTASQLSLPGFLKIYRLQLSSASESPMRNNNAQSPHNI